MIKSYIPKKKLGQNFLQNQRILQSIASFINPVADEQLVEIGPGLGALTGFLIKKTEFLHVVEIDRDLTKYLTKNFSGCTSLIVHEADALKFDFNSCILGSKKTNLFVVGNLPYNISTELLFYLSSYENISNMIFMLQKEVARRICSTVGSSYYSRLTVGLQHKYRCMELLQVSKDCFYPVPKVESAVVHFQRLHTVFPVDEIAFNKIVTMAFSQRRKCLKNSLASFENLHQDSMCKYLQLRPQDLRVEDFVDIANILCVRY